MKLRPFVALRHDVDTAVGLKGLKRIVDIEDRVGVRSTVYVRIKVLRKCLNMFRELARSGWRIGLHLDNSVDEVSLISPWEELETLERIAGFTLTLTVHGGVYGTAVKASLYKTCSMLPRYAINVWHPVPTYTLDWAVAELDEKGALEDAKLFTLSMLSSPGFVVLTHPEYFVLSVGKRLTMEPRSAGWRVRLLKLAEKATIAVYTMLGTRRVDRVYKEYLEWLLDTGFRVGTVEELLEELGLLPRGFSFSPPRPPTSYAGPC